jgi:hypothetical protein
VSPRNHAYPSGYFCFKNAFVPFPECPCRPRRTRNGCCGGKLGNRLRYGYGFCDGGKWRHNVRPGK